MTAAPFRSGRPVVGGVLLQEHETLPEGPAFLGIGYGLKGVPVEVAQIALLAEALPDFNLLVVDEFLRLNGRPEGEVVVGRDRLLSALDALGQAFGVRFPVTLASELMATEEYGAVYRRVEKRARSEGHEATLLETVPAEHRASAAARSYPFHEVACVAALAARGFSAKVGPSRERRYDTVIGALGIPVRFAYLAEAYALGVRERHPVVHYSPNGAVPGGQRLYLDDSRRVAEAKLAQGSDEALRALGGVAALAAETRGEEDPRSGMLDRYGKHLKRAVTGMVLDHILQPYQEARR